MQVPLYRQRTITYYRNKGKKMALNVEDREDSPANDFVNAITFLEDITTIHTDSNLTLKRAKLMRSGSNGGISDDKIREFEVFGIAKVVAIRFRSTPYHSHATEALYKAAIFCKASRRWSIESQNSVGESSARYRSCLRDSLDWVHRCGTVRDRDSANTHTCLCPVTAYLQLILRHTPMEDWAAASTDPNASPLGFAWAWARSSAWIGKQTADVTVLVTMGRHIHRLVARDLVRDERNRLDGRAFDTRILSDGLWATLRGVAQDILAKWLQKPPSDFDRYKRELEASNAKDLLETMQDVAGKLGEEGERYAQLLEGEGTAQDRKHAVDRIRTLTGWILERAEPPVPDTVLRFLGSLATAD
ncbi:hypothetical protein C0992_005068 [Termitomyces sp. T32_za158]|nr:hypothetical protein C0992_005068 [Termitomyces sp. T32_za158]